MKTNRGPGCLNFRKSFSKPSNELSSSREELEALDLRLGKGLMAQLRGDSMGLERGREIMPMVAMDRGTRVEDQQRNLGLLRTTIDLFLTT